MDELPYDDEFFRIVTDTGRASAAQVVPLVVAWLAPRSVVDVGCGEGAWLEAFAAAGCDVVGIDGAHVETQRLLIPRDAFVARDLEQPLGGLLGERRFDLAVSLEVAEHLAPERADSFVDDLVTLSDRVLFSAAVPGQGGYGHRNEQPHEYWTTRFEDCGFAVSTALRRRIADNPDVASWYRANLALFVRVTPA